MGTALGSAAFLLFSAAGSAQNAGNYPNRPIVLIVPFAPGGVSDFVACVLQPGISQILGQQILVENRPGAAEITGTELAARAAPDSYTTSLGNMRKGGAIAVGGKSPDEFKVGLHGRRNGQVDQGHRRGRRASGLIPA